jgi:hypothetical protein
VQPQTSSDVGSTRTPAGCRPATAREAVARSPLIEPLSVAHHAVTRGGVKAGDVALVGGAGPIGLLVAAMLKSLGVRTIVTELSEAGKAKGAIERCRGLRERPILPGRQGRGPRAD